MGFSQWGVRVFRQNPHKLGWVMYRCTRRLRKMKTRWWGLTFLVTQDPTWLLFICQRLCQHSPLIITHMLANVTLPLHPFSSLSLALHPTVGMHAAFPCLNSSLAAVLIVWLRYSTVCTLSMCWDAVHTVQLVDLNQHSLKCTPLYTKPCLSCPHGCSLLYLMFTSPPAEAIMGCRERGYSIHNFLTWNNVLFVCIQMYAWFFFEGTKKNLWECMLYNNEG